MIKAAFIAYRNGSTDPAVLKRVRAWNAMGAPRRARVHVAWVGACARAARYRLHAGMRAADVACVCASARVWPRKGCLCVPSRL